MRDLVASTVYCPDRTRWSWVGQDIWECHCCGMRVSQEDLVATIEVSA